ncbi:MAG: PQQ-dependent sugar dehydrogenase, partial [Pirellulaceae bacterium]
MKSTIIIPGLVIRATAFICFLAASLQSVLAEAPGKSTGIEKRTSWNNLHIHGTPDPPNPYATRVAFPHLKFFEPLAFSWVPAADRYAIATRPGKIFTFINQHDTRTKDLLIDLKRNVYGVVMHPKFSQNGYFYVSSVTESDHPEGSRLSRFRVTSRTPLTASPESEQVILKWPSGGHNGGCLRFGPAGYLYLATGDGSGIADERETGQDLSDLLGAILRIDVDHTEEGRNYRIPSDNPFISRKNARGEIYSYGHRQIWKYSFDQPTGELWAGEIGQDLWEMIYRIEKGGNYGWSVQEGTHPFRPQRPKGPTPILKPIVEHSHEDFRSITGGFVYHGSRLPELKGRYIYGGYDTGRIWGFRFRQGKVLDHAELAKTQIRLVAFAQDPSGEMIMLDYAGGQLHQLVKAPPVTQAKPFPRKLSETGLFSSTRQHRPAPGLIPYSVNAPLWSDHATKDRFIALP